MMILIELTNGALNPTGQTGDDDPCFGFPCAFQDFPTPSASAVRVTVYADISSFHDIRKISSLGHVHDIWGFVEL